MARVNVYLPDDLHALMKALDLSPSDLLQTAIRDAARLDERERAMDEFLAEGLAAHGPPTAEDVEWVDSLMAAAIRPGATEQDRKAS